jgi:hypothetical protein
MIPAYEKDWKPYKSTREEYIKNTVVTSEVEDIKKEIINYINKHTETEYVKQFLSKVLQDDYLLSKTQIVWDGSYRNVVWLVRPDIIETSGYYEYKKEIDRELSFDEAFKYVRDNCETFFINFDRQSSEDRKLQWELDREMFDYYLDEEIDFD